VTSTVGGLISDEDESLDAKRKAKTKTRKVVEKTVSKKPRSMVDR
jgi:hypothetical protein